MTADTYLALDPEDFDLLHKIPVCGCGYPGLAWRIYHTVLQDAASFTPGSERIAAAGGEALFYVVAGVLNDIECIEHGSSITSSWITDKGRRLLVILDRFAVSDYEAMPCVEIGGNDDERR